MAPHRLPNYPRKPHGSGQARVTVAGKDVYLGLHGSRESYAEFDRLRTRILEVGPEAAVGLMRPGDTSVPDLARAFTEFARGYYVKHGRPTSAFVTIERVMRELAKRFEDRSANQFRPSDLKAMRDAWIARDLAIKTINVQSQYIVAAFSWAVAEELVPSSVVNDLRELRPLVAGRCRARVTKPIVPVEWSVVEATLPFVSAPVAAMVRLQWLTGMRPGEATLVRPCDITESGRVKLQDGRWITWDGLVTLPDGRQVQCWLYVPESHKTEHHERERPIPIGPKAIEVLKPWIEKSLDRQPRGTAYVFDPRLSKRASPARCNERYSTRSYDVGIANACRRAGVESWAPNQLRKAAATRIQAEAGEIDAARVILGHADATTTAIYAKRDLNRARELAAMIG